MQKLGHFMLMSMLQFWKMHDPDFENEIKAEEQMRRGSVPNARDLCNMWRRIGGDMVKEDVFDFIAVTSGRDLAGNQTFYLIDTAFEPYGNFTTEEEIRENKITDLNEIPTI